MLVYQRVILPTFIFNHFAPLDSDSAFHVLRPTFSSHQTTGHSLVTRYLGGWKEQQPTQKKKNNNQ